MRENFEEALFEEDCGYDVVFRANEQLISHTSLQQSNKVHIIHHRINNDDGKILVKIAD
jgi:hypothetical protein